MQRNNNWDSKLANIFSQTKSSSNVSEYWTLLVSLFII